MILNNLYKSFNRTILSAWEKPILAMLQKIRMYLMQRIVVGKRHAKKWSRKVSPRMMKIIQRNTTLSRVEYVD